MAANHWSNDGMVTIHRYGLFSCISVTFLAVVLNSAISKLYSLRVSRFPVSLPLVNLVKMPSMEMVLSWSPSFT